MSSYQSQIDATAGVIANLLVFFLGIGLFTIVVANFMGLGRRETNTKCSLAIAITLIGILIAAVFATAEAWGTQLTFKAKMGFGITMLNLTTVSIVLGIIGLIEVVRRRKRYKKGLKRVITAQVVNCAVAGLMIAGFVASPSKPNGPAVAAQPSAPAQPSAIEQAPEPRATKPAVANDKEVVSKEWNFRLAIPSEWRRSLNPPSNPMVVATLLRANPEMSVFVSCESTNFDPNITMDTIVERLKESVTTRGKASFLGDTKNRDSGLETRTLEYLANTSEGPCYIANWSALHRGTLYRFIITAREQHREIARNEVKRLRASFSIIDPNRAVVDKATLAALQYDSPQFPFSVDLSASSWTRAWPTLATDSPSAEFGVQHANGNAWFCVVPVWLGDEGDQVDLKYLTNALSARFNIPFPDDGVYGLREVHKGFSGQAFAYESRGQQHPNVFRVRVLRSSGYAALLVAWTEKDKLPVDILDEALDCVQFRSRDLKPLSTELFSERQHYTHALVCNGVGIQLDRDGKNSEAKAWFRRAFQHRPQDVAIASNYVNTCVKLGAVEEASEFIEQNAAKLSEPARLRLLLADGQYSLGRTEEALAAYAKVFDSGHRDDTRFAGYVVDLAQRGHADEALAAVGRYAGRGLPIIRRAHSSVLLFKREFDKAIEILSELQRDLPNDRETTNALADSYFAAQRYAECIEQCDKLIQAKQDSMYVYRRKGLAEFSLKRHQDAKTSLERALEFEPSSEELKMMLARVSGLLGQGSNSSIKTEIEPVALPSGIAGPAKVDVTSPYLAGYSAWYVTLSQAIAFKKGVDFRKTERATITVRDQQGVEKFSTLEFRYDPFGEEIFVNSLVVKDANGEPLAKGKIDESYTVDDGVGEMATQHKILHIPVPGLKPGYTVEYAVTRREPAAKRLDFREHLFARGIPVLKSVLYFQGPTSDVKWEASASVPKPKTNENSILWSVSEPFVYRWEPIQAPATTFLPMVWLGDQGSDWKKESEDYLGQIKERLAIDDDIRAQARKLVEGVTDRDDKIAVISRFVQKELTYKALEFGRRARLPNAAAQTLGNKYGDCKDHALLLTQLLEAAGVPARMALVNSGREAREGLPSLDQFNHLITFIPGEGGGKFIDATNKLQDLRTLPPLLLPKQRALVLDEQNPKLVLTPEIPADSSAIASKREIVFVNEKDADISENLVLTGSASLPIRGVLQAIEPAHRNRQLLAMMNDKLPSLDLRDAQIEGVEDPQQPLTLKLRYAVRGQLKSAGSRLVGTLPAVWERMFTAATPVERRYTPFRVERPNRFSSEITIIPPKGWRAEQLTSQKTANEFSSAQSAIESSNDRIKLTATISQKAGQFEAKRYVDYCEAMDNALSLVEQPIIFKKQP